ncbi:MAG TPA: hydratase [bacterium]
MPSSSKLEALADLLAAARRDVRQITALPSDLMPPSADDAYRVNALVAARLGWAPLGWKIAGTTAHMRERLGVDAPIYGRTFRQFATQSPATFRVRDLLDPIVECEFFITLARDLPPRDTPYAMPDIVAAVATVHAGIEVPECRFPEANLPPLPAILADGAASGRYVYGAPLPGWKDGLAAVPIALEVDGILKRKGVGADVMGDPLVPLLWLANERRR